MTSTFDWFGAVELQRSLRLSITFILVQPTDNTQTHVTSTQEHMDVNSKACDVNSIARDVNTYLSSQLTTQQIHKSVHTVCESALLVAWEDEFDVGVASFTHEHAIEEPASAGTVTPVSDVHRLESTKVDRFNGERVSL